MATLKTPVVKRSLFSWIFYQNARLQILLVFIIFAVVFARVLPLEMQKRIVNEAINLGKIDLLLYYCGIYLASVITAAVLKYGINILETLIAQRATAHMRKALYHHILTLPLNFFRNTQPGAVVNALINEMTVPGNFVGMSVAAPLSNLLTLLAFAGYLIWLNPLLACVSLSIYPIVLLLLPLLQRKVNKTNKKRVDQSRRVSSRIAESVTGIHEIQGNGAFGIEGRKFDTMIDKLLKIRIIWSLYRFGIKSMNNFFTSLGPFLVFILGGYLTIKGQLELGALVAFLSAQEKLYDPWKELIEFYQVYQEGRVNYDRTMELFDVAPEHLLTSEDRDSYDLENSIEVKNLSFITDDGIRLLDDINFSLDPGEHMALVGFSGSGKSTLALCVGQLYKYSSGHATIGGKEVSDLTKEDMVRNIGFISQAPFIFQGTIRDNLLYAVSAANSSSNNGGEGREPSLDDMISGLQQSGLFIDVLRFGLNTVIHKGRLPELVDAILRIRRNFKAEYGEELSKWVEFYTEDKYLYYSGISNNLIFGTSNTEAFTASRLASNDYFMKFLNDADLTRPLLTLGAELTVQTVDILKNLPPDELFFEQSPIGLLELNTYKEVAGQLKKKKLHQLGREPRRKLLELALRFAPGRHKMAALPGLLETLILEGRSMFHDLILKDDPDAISFFQMDEYIHSQTILNNILFGKTKSANPEVQEKINQSIIQLLIEEELLETIVEIGMSYEVGTKGDKLSGGQRQKLAIARALLKHPKILIMDEATSALDNKSQSRIQKLLEHRWKGKNTVIAVVHRLDIIKGYNKVAVMKAGKIVEMGSYIELIEKKGTLYELEYGKK
ncbi:MAG: ABC transporter ATP-binding protein/permease [Desulfobacteraceae bacterium]|nr:ABC transporter ATP-binding protein/permease [Desulfobacteraceae bacterium]